MIWSDLKDLELAAGGGIDSVGFIVELAGHKHVARWGPAEVLLGVDFAELICEDDYFDLALMRPPVCRILTARVRSTRQLIDNCEMPQSVSIYSDRRNANQ